MKRDMNPRTCIVTRTEQSPDLMVRFVLDPESRVVPDLKRKLPGRGVWVSCDKALVQQAVAKGLFSRGFKAKVEAGQDLPDLVESLMCRNALDAISLAKKAGVVVPGQAKAEAAMRSGEAGLLLMASDAGADGVTKMGFALRTLELHDGLNLPLFRSFASAELDGATGGVNVMHLAILSGGMAGRLQIMLERLRRYRGEDAPVLEKAK